MRKARSFGVLAVERPVDNVHRHVHDGIPARAARGGRLGDALADRADELPRDAPAGHFVGDEQAAPAFPRSHLDDHVAILAAAAGLLDLPAFAGRGGGDRRFVGDLRRTGARRHLEVFEHAQTDHFEVQFTHARDQRLSGFRVGAHLEGRIVFRQSLEDKAHPLLIRTGFRFDGHRHDRRREGRRFQQHRSVFCAQRVARGHLAEAGHHGDIARENRVERHLLVRANFGNAIHAFAPPGRGIQDHIARPQHTRIHAHEHVPAMRLVGRRFEDQRAQGVIVPRGHGDALARFRIGPNRGRQIHGTRQIIDHRIEQRLHAEILEGRSARNRDETIRDGLPADGRLQHQRVDLAVGEERLGERLVNFRQRFDERLARLRGARDPPRITLRCYNLAGV